jgi:hypothetical protein
MTSTNVALYYNVNIYIKKFKYLTKSFKLNKNIGFQEPLITMEIKQWLHLEMTHYT